ncbi:MAG: GTP-binding protein [Gammaproteobacteria bacterium]|nr:GTP-binding protein [Gammaproteobacteria bacterium]
MAILTKKICLIGDFAVGKTSLVSRYVHGIFSDRYLTTIGVKIDTKQLTISGRGSIKLVLWDIAGTDRFSTMDTHYLRGAAAYLLVVDGTRRDTLDTALQLKKSADQFLNSPPFVMIFNKTDLQDEWEITDAELQRLQRKGWNIVRTSAKQGSKVEHAFGLIASSLLR